MLDHFDNLLRHLFIAQIDEITSEVQVRFQPPDESWRQYVTNLTVNGAPANALNVYLLELRENRTLRSNERTRQFQNGMVTTTPAPRQIDCYYLITAWSPATATEAVEPTLDEHALLYKATVALMKNEALVPRKVYAPDPLPATFPELIADAELAPTVLPGEGFAKYPEFWGTMGANYRWKPAIYLIVALPVVMQAEVAGPMVTTRITEYRLSGKPETAEVWIQIGGKVFEAANPALVIEGAQVRLVERDQTVATNGQGQFVFTGLLAGNYTLEVTNENSAKQTKNIVVPAAGVDAYDVGLSP